MIKIAIVLTLLPALLWGQELQNIIVEEKPIFMRTAYIDNDIIVKYAVCYNSEGIETNNVDNAEECKCYIDNGKDKYHYATYLKKGDSWEKLIYDIEGKEIDKCIMVKYNSNYPTVDSNYLKDPVTGNDLLFVSKYFYLKRKNN